MPWPVISTNPQIQAAYEHSRSQGTSHALAEMFATAQPPRLHTDKALFFGTEQTGGKRYISQLADFPNDPKAWVSDGSDIRRRLRERGDYCDRLGVKPVVTGTPSTPTRLAPDIVANYVEDYIAADPSLASKPKEEVAEMVIDRHGPA